MGSPAEMGERVQRLDEALVAAGRDPESVVKSVLYVPSVTPDEDPWASVDAFEDFVSRYREQGVRDFIFQPAHAPQDLIERVSHEVLPSLRKHLDILPPQ
jgi:alkanesulfonate monooxygenase SsuD/methylene tetrahydromethanopterin reductase-like flavin-dependent oxidoreductase (luciferase family)